jgi:hypothetical protein
MHHTLQINELTKQLKGGRPDHLKTDTIDSHKMSGNTHGTHECYKQKNEILAAVGR